MSNKIKSKPVCPHCGSEDGEGCESNFGDELADLEMICLNCEAIYWIVYKFAYVVDTDGQEHFPKGEAQ